MWIEDLEKLPKALADLTNIFEVDISSKRMAIQVGRRDCLAYFLKMNHKYTDFKFGRLVFPDINERIVEDDLPEYKTQFTQVEDVDEIELNDSTMIRGVTWATLKKGMKKPDFLKGFRTKKD